MNKTCKFPLLAEVAALLKGSGIRFAFIHEAALAAWGLSYATMLRGVDVLLFDKKDADSLGVEIPRRLGSFSLVDAVDASLRVWSCESLGLQMPFDVVTCTAYECESLAPEIVLEKLPYSPDARLLLEARARLAEVLYFDRMDDEQLKLFDSYIRGD